MYWGLLGGAAYLVATMAASRVVVAAAARLGFATRLENAVASVLRALRKFVWPSPYAQAAREQVAPVAKSAAIRGMAALAPAPKSQPGDRNIRRTASASGSGRFGGGSAGVTASATGTEVAGGGRRMIDYTRYNDLEYA